MTFRAKFVMSHLYCEKISMEYFIKFIHKIRISIAYGNKYLRIFVRFFFFKLTLWGIWWTWEAERIKETDGEEGETKAPRGEQAQVKSILADCCADLSRGSRKLRIRCFSRNGRNQTLGLRGREDWGEKGQWRKIKKGCLAVSGA